MNTRTLLLGFLVTGLALAVLAGARLAGAEEVSLAEGGAAASLPGTLAALICLGLLTLAGVRRARVRMG